MLKKLNIFRNTAQPKSETNTASLASVLSMMIDLTNERDIIVLERLLIGALEKLVSGVLNRPPKQLLICKPNANASNIFSIISITQHHEANGIDDTTIDLINHCIAQGVVKYGKQSSETYVYPVKNNKNETLFAVLLTMDAQNENLHQLITMMLTVYKNFTGLIIDNERDMLTGMRNRKTFETTIKKVLTNLAKTGHRHQDDELQYFFAIFDIDHFKLVNDNYGHIMGDEVLILFSNIMNQSFRNVDMLFRFGGEEFVGVFECRNIEQTHFILNRFREEVANYPFPRVGNIHASIGFTQINSQDSSSQVLDRADAALYYAKNNGRNQVAFYEALLASNAIKNIDNSSEIDFF